MKDAIAISRQEIKDELSRMYRAANRWTYIGRKATDPEEKANCLNRHNRVMSRINGIEALLLHAANITFSERYIDEPEYHETMWPRYSAVVIAWTENDEERVELNDGSGDLPL